MAIKLFSKLFSRKKRIAMTSDEAFLSDESDEPRDEVPKEEPAPQPEPAAEEASAGDAKAEDAPAEQPEEAAADTPESEEAPAAEEAKAEEPEPEPLPPQENLCLWLYACLDDPHDLRTPMRPQLIAHFRALNEGSDGFEGTLPSGGRVTCAVRTDLGFVREQAGYLKTRFADTFPADRDVWNAAMMQIELFNTRVECTLAPPYSEDDAAKFADAVYAAAEPLRGFVVNEGMELYRWDRRLVIAPDGRTDFSVFMPIRRGLAVSNPAEAAAADEARMRRSIAILKKHGVEAARLDMPVQAREADARLRTPEEIIGRMAALFACAVKAQAYTSPREVAAPAAWSLNAIKKLDTQYGVNRLFTAKEAEYVVRSPESQHETYLMRFEDCAVLLWALRMYELDWPAGRADVAAIARVIRDADTETILRLARPRPLNDILNMHDVTYRLHSVCVREGDAAFTGAKPDHDVVYERHYALNWLVAVDGISDWDMIVPKT